MRRCNNPLTCLSMALAVTGLGACATAPPAPPAIPANAIGSQASALCEIVDFTLYFASGARDLDRFSKDMVNQAAERVRGCQRFNLTVEGFTDASGAEAINATVSQQRAQSVAQALIEAGAQPDGVIIAGRGEVGAISEDGDAEPARRRVVVTLAPVS